MIRLAAVAIAAFGVTGCAATWAASSGVDGRVTLSPACAGPQLRDQACAAPLAAVRVLLIDGSGKTVGSAQTSADGRFEIDAPAGNYRVEVAIGKQLPRCPSLEVTLTRGRRSEADIACDSGMR